MNYFLVKQEPATYSFDDLMHEGKTEWSGVRNFLARNNLRLMKTGDKVLFYHSIAEKAVVGLAEVTRESFQDSTDSTEKWVAVEIKPLEKFAKPVSLEDIKENKALANIPLLKQSRLSVMRLTEIEYDEILSLSKNQI